MKNLMKGAPPVRENQVTLANWRTAPFNRWAFSNVRSLIPTVNMIGRNSNFSYPIDGSDLSDVLLMDAMGGTLCLEEFLRNTKTDCFIVLRDERVIFDWFDGFGTPHSPHIVFSVSKSLTALLVGVLEGKDEIDLDRNVVDYVPDVKGSAYEGATIRNLLDMNVASNFVENYLDTSGVFFEYRKAMGWNQRSEDNGLWGFLPTMPSSNAGHGEVYHYCSPHTDMLGWVIEKATGGSFAQLFSDLILKPCQSQYDSYITVDSFGAPRTAGGINICAYDLVKVAEMVRCDGAFFGRQIVPESWISDFRFYDNKEAWRRQPKEQRHLSFFPEGNYRSNWYQTGSEDEEFYAIGIHGQWIWINPKKKISIVKMSSLEYPVDPGDYSVHVKAFQEICRQA